MSTWRLEHEALKRRCEHSYLTEIMLNDEQQEPLRAILRRALAAKLASDKLNIFIRNVGSSLDAFSRERNSDGLTPRQIRDRLRKLWFLAYEEDDPRVGLIRAEIDKLPNSVVKRIERRAPRVVATLYGDRPHNVAMAGGKTIKIEDIQTRSWADNGGFRAWAQKADGSLLGTAVRILAGGGARIVEGRSRGGGKRSKPNVEPQILGITRGVKDERPKGGRPRAENNKSLVRNLAIDWHSATGSPPEPGRSGLTGFGELVYAAFSWAAAADNVSQDAASASAEFALRAYWESHREAKALDKKRERRRKAQEKLATKTDT